MRSLMGIGFSGGRIGSVIFPSLEKAHGRITKWADLNSSTDAPATAAVGSRSSAPPPISGPAPCRWCAYRSPSR